MYPDDYCCIWNPCALNHPCRPVETCGDLNNKCGDLWRPVET